MNDLESFLEKYENDLDSIVIGGGWAVEIYQDKAHNPHRNHHDIDTLVLDENLNVENDSHPVLGEYFWSIDVESVDWLRKFIVEKQVTCKNKTYDVQILCPEFIAVSKAFTRIDEPRTKDNKDIEHIFDTIDLNKEKIYSLIEKAGLLQKDSCFLDMMAEKGLEPVKYSRDNFNKKIFKDKFNLEKIPEHMTSETMKSCDLLLSQIKKGFGTGWIKNHKKRVQEILNNTNAQKIANYGSAIKDALEFAGESMKKGLVKRLLDIPDSQEAESYGWAIESALEYAEDSMKKDLADKMLDIPDAREAWHYGETIGDTLKYAGEGMKADLADRILNIPDLKKAKNYGYTILSALRYSVEGMKESLTDRLLSIPNAKEARTYGIEIGKALMHAEKDMDTQQRLINQILGNQNE